MWKTLTTIIGCSLIASCAGVSRAPICQPGYAVTGAGTCEQDEHCYDLEECKVKGNCTTYGDQCVAGSNADCQQSAHCRDFGECSLEPQKGTGLGTCVVSEEGCASSAACAEYGKCSLSRTKPMCIVESDDDCANARVCREEKRCTATRMKSANGATSDIMSCQMSN